MNRYKTYTKRCVVCGNEFTSTRSDAKCCCSKCRSYLSRGKDPVRLYVEKLMKGRRKELFPTLNDNDTIEVVTASDDYIEVIINKSIKISTKIEEIEK